MRKQGKRLIIEPAPPQSLIALLATLKPLKEDFPAIPDPVPDPNDAKVYYGNVSVTNESSSRLPRRAARSFD